MMGNGTLQSRQPERKAAFLDLIQWVEAPLREFVRLKMGSANLAADIVQQTFLKAWSHGEFDPSRNDARAFLFTTASHLISDWFRSNQSWSVSLDELSARGSLVPSLVDRHAHDPLARMIAEETADILHAALTRLSSDHQEVLDRFYLRQEGSQFQIADAMGLSVAAFNSRLNRARVELKRMLLILRDDRDGARS